tara:strand:+ start:163 stop:570 length:408 start_codon:yes stop_codon:yes gene_type:complete
MDWYIKVVRDNYFNFEGRARREEYWMFTLVNTIIIVAVDFIDKAVSGPEGWILGAIYTLAIMIPSVAVNVRRFHDINKSGWWVLGLALFVVVGWIWGLVLACQDSDIGDNSYGSSDKYPDGNDESDDDFLLDEEE